MDLNIEVFGCSSSQLKKELQIRLTNDADSFFLQHLVVGEDEFQRIKDQQGLLVDFGSFPQMLVDLLETCCKEQHCESPRFTLQFTPANTTQSPSHQLGKHASLEIVETNPFKHLVHLNLRFMKGTDDEVKKHLAKCLQLMKEEKEALAYKLSSCERDLSARLTSAQEALSLRTKELDEMRFQMSAKLCEATSDKMVEVNEEKEKTLKLQRQYEQQIQQQRKDIEEKYQNKVKRMESRLAEQESVNKSLMDQKYKHEAVIREMKGRLMHLEEERALVMKDLQHLRRQNTGLDSERHERDKTLNHLRTRVAVLEQELKDKEQVNAQSSELLQTSQEQKKHVEEDLEERIRQVNQLNASIKSVSAEVVKGNEIIQKLQKEMRNAQHKNKLMSIVASKQEHAIHEKDALLLQKSEEISSLQADVRKYQDQVKSIQLNLNDTTEKLDSSKETLKNKENMIEWLNKQLNEQTMGRIPGPHDSSAAVSSRVHYTGKQTMAHSTPSIPQFAPQQQRHPGVHVPYLPFNGVHQPRVGQEPYRSILKNVNPLVHAEGVSPIPINADTMNLRVPLRERQLAGVPVPAEGEPVLDPKYLMRKAPEKVQDENQVIVGGIEQSRNTIKRNVTVSKVDNENVGIVSGTSTNSKAKPFPLQSAYFPHQK